MPEGYAGGSTGTTVSSTSTATTLFTPSGKSLHVTTIDIKVRSGDPVLISVVGVNSEAGATPSYAYLTTDDGWRTFGSRDSSGRVGKVTALLASGGTTAVVDHTVSFT